MAPALDVYDDSFAENAKLGALGKTKSGKKLKIRTYPKFETLEEERLYRKQHLAAAFREFADRGFDEGVRTLSRNGIGWNDTSFELARAH